MHLDPAAADRLHADQAVTRATHFARMLNETLDELVGHGIYCMSVDNPRSHDRTPGSRRVELLLLFLAQKAAS